MHRVARFQSYHEEGPPTETALLNAFEQDRASRSGNACQHSTLAARVPKEALANTSRQDADCSRVTGCQHLQFLARHIAVEPNKGRMTPCKKSKSIPMRGSCWKPTAPGPLRKPPRMPSNWNQKARSSWPELGGISKTP